VGVRLEADVAIVGGGIAGLWVLGELRQAGYTALLCERETLGCGQTVASQGIIHGGTKYALTGSLSAAARAIGAMPARWQRALTGQGSVSLRGARLLSDYQYLWSTGELSSRLTGFLAGRLMRSRVSRQAPESGPELFRNPDFSGVLYRLQEPVLDVYSVLGALRAQFLSSLLAVDLPAAEMSETADGRLVLKGRFAAGVSLCLTAKSVVVTAGIGNETFAVVRHAGAAQRRPLAMVLARGDLPLLYGHCLGPGYLPRLTITTHRDAQGRAVWYIGGAVAERGVTLAIDAHIKETRQVLREALPWFDFDGVEWSTLNVARAEPKVAGGQRPDSAAVITDGALMLAWPTKLALAPVLAERVLAILRARNVTPTHRQLCDLDCYPRPRLAEYPWDRELQWS
jgi:glycine/D-amino acid oxidase-like deaminating enzyme